MTEETMTLMAEIPAYLITPLAIAIIILAVLELYSLGLRTYIWYLNRRLATLRLPSREERLDKARKSIKAILDDLT